MYRLKIVTHVYMKLWVPDNLVLFFYHSGVYIYIHIYIYIYIYIYITFCIFCSWFFLGQILVELFSLEWMRIFLSGFNLTKAPLRDNDQWFIWDRFLCNWFINGNNSSPFQFHFPLTKGSLHYLDTC